MSPIFVLFLKHGGDCCKLLQVVSQLAPTLGFDATCVQLGNIPVVIYHVIVIPCFYEI
jgi:hypothetical protein